MSSILGIDAAWTPAQPSGVALLSGVVDSCRWATVAPGYAFFVALGRRAHGSWDDGPAQGSRPELAAAVAAAEAFSAATPVDVVAIDLPDPQP
jgi:hypothetical protein